MNSYLFDKLREPLPSQTAAIKQSMYGEALGMLSAQAGAVSESSDDEKQNPLDKNNDYKNAKRNLENCEKDIADLEDSITDDMDTEKRRKVLAKLTEKKEYLKTLKAKLKLVEAVARKKLQDGESSEKEDSNKDDNVNERVETTIGKVIGNRHVQNKVKKDSKEFRKNPEYKKLQDQLFDIQNKIIILTDKINYVSMRFVPGKGNDYEKIAAIKEQINSLDAKQHDIETKMDSIERQMRPSLPVSYWKNRAREVERWIKNAEARVEKAEKACNSLAAQRDPAVKKEFTDLLSINKKAVGNCRHYLNVVNSHIPNAKTTSPTESKPVNESVYDEYMIEANIFQKAAIKADTLVNKNIMKNYRKDPNYKAIDDSWNELNEKIHEMDIDITKLESKDKYDEAERLKVQQQKLILQQDKLGIKEAELRLKVEDSFPRSYWRKELEKQRKLIEKLQKKYEKCERHIQFLEKQDAPELLTQFKELVKDRKAALDDAKKLYDDMQKKYDAAEDK